MRGEDEEEEQKRHFFPVNNTVEVAFQLGPHGDRIPLESALLANQHL